MFELQRRKVPLYAQLEQILKSKILIGEFLPGDKIPAEKEIGDAYGVSTITVRQAVLNLVREGYLVRKPGKGTFVAKALGGIKDIKTLYLRGDISDILPEGLKSQKVEVLGKARIRAPRKVAEVLKLGIGDEIVLIRRVRSEKGVPISYVKNYMPLEIGERVDVKELRSRPMLEVLRSTMGINISHGVQYVEAVVADYEVAQALDVGVSSPILYLETTIYEDKGSPVELVQTFYRPDQFRYSVLLEVKKKKEEENE